MYPIKFPIGDWFDTSHHYCDFFLVYSDKPIEAVREAHLKIKEMFDISLEQFTEDFLDEKDKLLEKLKNLGFSESAHEVFMDGKWYLKSQDMLKIWLFLLNKIDNDLNLKSFSFDDIPVISIQDKIGNIGSGCLFDWEDNEYV